MSENDLLTSRLPFIRTLPAHMELSKHDLCVTELLVESEREIEIYYAPFDYLNPTARIVIIGITPGWEQMRLSYEVFRAVLADGTSVDQAQQRAKVAASFAGPMRTNLTNMLDAIGVAQALGLESTRMLFSTHHALAHTTSALRYPVFVNGKNYTGHSPSPFRRAILEQAWRSGLAEELQAMQKTPLIVPLGDTVTKMVETLIEDGVVPDVQCLLSFPHPSGGNGHRVRHFGERKAMLAATVRGWAEAS